MPARKHVASELIAEGKYLYERTLTSVDEIAARMKISPATLYVRQREWKWQRRRYSPSVAANQDRLDAQAAASDTATLAQKRAVPSQVSGAKAAIVTVEQRAALFARAFRAAELQMDSIEAAMQTLNSAPAPFERTARALAMLNRSLRDILALTKADEANLTDEANDHSIPRDMDEFRFELAQRIQRLVDAERSRESAGSGALRGA